MSSRALCAVSRTCCSSWTWRGSNSPRTIRRRMWSRCDRSSTTGERRARVDREFPGQYRGVHPDRDDPDAGQAGTLGRLACGRVQPVPQRDDRGGPVRTGRRVADVDDLILNTAGGVLGYCILRLSFGVGAPGRATTKNEGPPGAYRRTPAGRHDLAWRRTGAAVTGPPGRSIARSLRGRRQDHGVDDVDHAVGALDVRLDDLGAVDGDRPVLDGDLGGAPLDRLDVLAVEPDDVGGHGLRRDDVVLQDRDELVLVLGLEQALDRPLGQLGERLVGRRQHGERPLALERLHQAGGLDRGDQRLEVVGAGRRVHDVLLVAGQGRERPGSPAPESPEICAC